MVADGIDQQVVEASRHGVVIVLYQLQASCLRGFDQAMRSTRYPEAVRAKAIQQIVYMGRATLDVARELDLSAPTVYRWVRQHRWLAVEQPTLEARNTRASSAAADRKLLLADVKNSRDELNALRAIHADVCAERDSLRSAVQAADAVGAQRERAHAEFEVLRTEHANLAETLIRVRAERNVLEMALALLARRNDTVVAGGL
jgi:transposase-like protein